MRPCRHCGDLGQDEQVPECYSQRISEKTVPRFFPPQPEIFKRTFSFSGAAPRFPPRSKSDRKTVARNIIENMRTKPHWKNPVLTIPFPWNGRDAADRKREAAVGEGDRILKTR